MNDSNKKSHFGITIFLLLIAVTLVVIALFQQAKIGIKASDFPDYEAYKSFNKKVPLVKDQTSFVTITTDHKYKIEGEVRKQLSPTGKFSRAYIFIGASVDNGRPLTVYDSIFVCLNNKRCHILRNQTLPVPASDITQLLYDMRNVPCIKNIPYSETKEPLAYDWLKEINLGKEIPFYTFLSSSRRGGLIKEITIAFECEENSNCNISVK